MARKILTMVAIAILLFLISEVVIYAKNDTSSNSEYVNVSTEESPLSDYSEDMNDYTIEKMIINNELYHSETVELLGCVIKLQFALIVCELLLAGALVSWTVIKHLPEG